MTDYLKRNALWILLILLALAIYLLPIKIPADINTMGKVYSEREYILHTGNDGQVRESIINLATGIHEEFRVREPERGDDIRLHIVPHVFTSDIIHRHDTLAKFFSFSTMLKLTSLKSELDVVTAMLDAAKSGEKPAAIQLAEKRKKYATIDAEIQERMYQRQKVLFENEVIADQEFEDQQRLVELKKTQVAISEAELQALESGEKPAQINYIKSLIRKVKTEIANLELKVANQIITSPINGIYRNSFSPDTLIIIEDIDRLIIKLPVPLEDMKFVYPGQQIVFKIDGMKETINAEVTNVSRNVTVLNARQVVLVTACFTDNYPDILPGAVLRGKLKREPVLLRKFLVDRFEVFFGR
jgi:hypothetical protein